MKCKNNKICAVQQILPPARICLDGDVRPRTANLCVKH